MEQIGKFSDKESDYQRRTDYSDSGSVPFCIGGSEDGSASSSKGSPNNNANILAPPPNHTFQPSDQQHEAWMVAMMNFIAHQNTAGLNGGEVNEIFGLPPPAFLPPNPYHTTGERSSSAKRKRKRNIIMDPTFTMMDEDGHNAKDPHPMSMPWWPLPMTLSLSPPTDAISKNGSNHSGLANKSANYEPSTFPFPYFTEQSSFGNHAINFMRPPPFPFPTLLATESERSSGKVVPISPYKDGDHWPSEPEKDAVNFGGKIYSHNHQHGGKRVQNLPLPFPLGTQPTPRPFALQGYTGPQNGLTSTPGALGESAALKNGLKSTLSRTDKAIVQNKIIGGTINTDVPQPSTSSGNHCIDHILAAGRCTAEKSKATPSVTLSGKRGSDKHSLDHVIAEIRKKTLGLKGSSVSASNPPLPNTTNDSINDKIKEKISAAQPIENSTAPTAPVRRRGRPPGACNKNPKKSKLQGANIPAPSRRIDDLNSPFVPDLRNILPGCGDALMDPNMENLLKYLPFLPPPPPHILFPPHQASPHDKKMELLAKEYSALAYGSSLYPPSYPTPFSPVPRLFAPLAPSSHPKFGEMKELRTGVDFVNNLSHNDKVSGASKQAKEPEHWYNFPQHSMPNSGTHSQPEMASSTCYHHHKRRKLTDIDEGAIRKPLEPCHGWERRTLLKGMAASGPRGEVTYITPCGKRLRSYPEVERYIEKRNLGSALSPRLNFSFSSKVVVGQFFRYHDDDEPEIHKLIYYTENEVNEMVNETRSQRATLSMTGITGGSLHNNVSNGGGSTSSEGIPNDNSIDANPNNVKSSDFLQRNHIPGATSDLANQHHTLERSLNFVRLPSEQHPNGKGHDELVISPAMIDSKIQANNPYSPFTFPHFDGLELDANTLKTLYKSKNKGDAENYHYAEKNDLKKISHENSDLAHAKWTESHHSIHNKAFCPNLPPGCIQNPTAQNVFGLPKEHWLESKMARRRYEIYMAKEMKKPQEDLSILKESKELPDLPIIPNVKISMRSFSQLVMVLEFVHNFADQLEIDTKNGRPTIYSLQASLFNRDKDRGEEINNMAVALLTKLFKDPDLTANVNALRCFNNETFVMMGKHIIDAEIDGCTLSEFLRLYIVSQPGIASLEVAEQLSTHPFKSLSPDCKIWILFYLCDRLLEGNLVTAKIDHEIDIIAGVRKDKWANEGEIRRLKLVNEQESLSQLYNNEYEANVDDHDQISKANTAQYLSIRPANDRTDGKVEITKFNVIPLTGEEGINDFKIGEGLKQELEFHEDDIKSTKNSEINERSDNLPKREKTDANVKREIDSMEVDDEKKVNFQMGYIKDEASSECHSTGGKVESSGYHEETQMGKLLKLQKEYRRKLFMLDSKTRLSCLGQDRYRRRYWVLPAVGALLVEGLDTEHEGDVCIASDKEFNYLTKPLNHHTQDKENLIEPNQALEGVERDEQNVKLGEVKRQICGSFSSNIDHEIPQLTPGSVDFKRDTVMTSMDDDPSIPADALAKHRALVAMMNMLTPLIKNQANLREIIQANEVILNKAGIKLDAASNGNETNLPSSEFGDANKFIKGVMSTSGLSIDKAPLKLNQEFVKALENPEGLVDQQNKKDCPSFGSTQSAILDRNHNRHVDVNSPFRDTLSPEKDSCKGNPASVGFGQKSLANATDLGYTGKWWYIKDMDQLKNLTSCLNERGIREKCLFKSLNKYMSIFDTISSFEESQMKLGYQIGDGDGSSFTTMDDSLGKRLNTDVTIEHEVKSLEAVESLEFKVHNANMQNKFWELPPKLSQDPSIKWAKDLGEANKEHQQSQNDEKCFDPLLVAKQRLAALEFDLERRYIKPPLGKGIKENFDATAVLKWHTSRSLPGNINSKEDSIHKNMPENQGGAVEFIDKISCESSENLESLNIEIAENQSSVEQDLLNLNQNLLTNTGSLRSIYTDVPSALAKWRIAVANIKNASQLHLCLRVLKNSIAWEKSIMKVFCQLCLFGNNEDKLLLCDGCDKGYHMYCLRPKMEIVPEGDWFCHQCISKATGESLCSICGQKFMKLIKCDKCTRLFHQECFDPPCSKVNKSRWKCPACTNQAKLCNGHYFAGPTSPHLSQSPLTQSTDSKSMENDTSDHNLTGTTGELNALTKSRNEGEDMVKRDSPNPHTQTTAPATNTNSPKTEAFKKRRRKNLTATSCMAIKMGATPLRNSRSSAFACNAASSKIKSGNSDIASDATLRNTVEVDEYTFSEPEGAHYSLEEKRKSSNNVYTSPPAPLPDNAKNCINHAKNLPPEINSLNCDHRTDVTNQATNGEHKHDGINPEELVKDAMSTSDDRNIFDILTTSASTSEQLQDGLDDKVTSDPTFLKSASGEIDITQCKKILADMKIHEDSWPFLHPVNTKTFPQYKKIIKHPMDLHTLETKLNQHTYTSAPEFVADVKLMLDNCEIFNEDDSEVGRAGHEMRKYFDGKWLQSFQVASRPPS